MAESDDYIRLGDWREEENKVHTISYIQNRVDSDTLYNDLLLCTLHWSQ